MSSSQELSNFDIAVMKLSTIEEKFNVNKTEAIRIRDLAWDKLSFHQRGQVLKVRTGGKIPAVHTPVLAPPPLRVAVPPFVMHQIHFMHRVHAEYQARIARICNEMYEEALKHEDEPAVNKATVWDVYEPEPMVNKATIWDFGPTDRITLRAPYTPVFMPWLFEHPNDGGAM